MNAPDPIPALDPLITADEFATLLHQVLSRLIRIETRLVRLMLHHNVNPAPEKETTT